MNVNVTKLQEVMKKATLSYVIPSVKLDVSGEHIVSRMRSQNNSVVIVLDIPNDVFSEVSGDMELCFDEPASKVKPYLSEISSEVVQGVLTDDKLLLKDGKHKTNLHFCMSSFVTAFSGNEPRLSPFYTLDIDEQVKDCFSKIRRIAGKFEKVYFSVRDNTFIVETTDRTNRYSNGISFELDTVTSDNLDICLDFKNFNALLTCLGEDITEFTAKFTWMAAQSAGMVLFEKEDGTEKYYLLSRIEG